MKSSEGKSRGVFGRGRGIKTGEKGPHRGKGRGILNHGKSLESERGNGATDSKKRPGGVGFWPNQQ